MLKFYFLLLIATLLQVATAVGDAANLVPDAAEPAVKIGDAVT